VTAADRALLAADWIDLIERVAAGTEDPAERARLNEQYDRALAMLERATTEAAEVRERAAVQAGIERWARTLAPSSAGVDTGPLGPIARAVRREREKRLEREAWARRVPALKL
jgi:hypothetical protein